MQQIIRANEDADELFRMPSFHTYEGVDTGVLLNNVVQDLNGSDSVDVAKAQLMAALRELDREGQLPNGVQVFRNHSLEKLQILRNAVEEILLGSRNCCMSHSFFSSSELSKYAISECALAIS